MPDFNTLVHDFGPLLAAVIVGVGAVWGTVKLSAAKFIEAEIEDRKVTRSVELEAKRQKTELAGEAAAAERQDEIALLSQVVHLTNSVLAQNKTLLEFITTSMRDDLQGMKTVIDNDLRDIEQRWLAATREIAEGKAKTHILTIEVAELSRRFSTVETGIMAVLDSGNGKEK